MVYNDDMAKKEKSVRNSRRSNKSSAWQLSAVTPGHNARLWGIVVTTLAVVAVLGIGWWWASDWSSRGAGPKSVTMKKEVQGNAKNFWGQYEGGIGAERRAELIIRENGELAITIGRVVGLDKDDEEGPRIDFEGQHFGYWERVTGQRIKLLTPTLADWNESEWSLLSGQLTRSDNNEIVLVKERPLDGMVQNVDE